MTLGCSHTRVGLLQTNLNSSSHIAPYSATYGRTPVKTLLLAADGGKSMVSTRPELQGLQLQLLRSRCSNPCVAAPCSHLCRLALH
jgi:hypothetical protein